MNPFFTTFLYPSFTDFRDVVFDNFLQNLIRFYFSSFSLFVIIFYFSSFFITFCLHLWRFTEFRHVVLQHRFLTPNLYFYSRVQRFKFYTAWGTTSLFLIFHHFSSFFVSLYDVSRNFNASFFILFSSFFHHFFHLFHFFIFSKFSPKKTLLLLSSVARSSLPPQRARSFLARFLTSVVVPRTSVLLPPPNRLPP